jgi:mRNA interferase HigB
VFLLTSSVCACIVALLLPIGYNIGTLVVYRRAFGEDWCMHIITRKRLNEFAAKHPNATPGLVHWYRTLKPTTIRSFAELRTLFPSADQVGKLTVFNIGGNTARLIVAMHYNRQKAYIRAVLTHDEYTQGTWKE